MSHAAKLYTLEVLAVGLAIVAVVAAAAAVLAIGPA